MKKFRILTTGASLLASVAAFMGAPAYAAQMHGTPMYADETEITGKTRPEYGVPSGEIESYPAITRAWIKMPEDGFSVLALNPGSTAEIVVRKDGVVIQTSPVNGPDVFIRFTEYGSPHNNLLGVQFHTPLSEPGNYEVDFPGGVVSYGAFTPEYIASSNAPYTLKFTIKNTPVGIPSVEIGKEVTPEDMINFSLTYPEGTSITYTAGDTAPSVEHWDGTYCNPDTQVAEPQFFHLSDYDVTVEANIVRLSAKNPEKVVATSIPMTSQWEAVRIPAGVLTLVKDGETYTNTQLTYEPYAIRNPKPTGESFEPKFSETGLRIAELDEIRFTLPASATYSGKTTPNTTVLTLYAGDNYNYNTAYIYTFKELSADGRTVTCVAKDPSNAYSAANNRAIAQTGHYNVRIPKGLYTLNGSSNAQIDLPAYDLVGLESNPIYNSTPRHGATVDKVNTLTLNLLANARIVEGKGDEQIQLFSTGKTEPIASFAVSTTTTAKAAIAGAGSTSIAYPAPKVDGNFITAPGTYRYVIPAGIFEQTSNGWLNEAKEIEFYIAEASTNCTFEPASGVYADGQFTCESQFTELPQIKIIFPDATSVSLSPDYPNILQNSRVGTIKEADMAKENPTVNAIPGFSFSDASVEGNTVTLTLNTPFNRATPVGRYVGVQIAKGLVVINRGEGENATSAASAPIYARYNPIPVCPGQVVDGIEQTPLSDPVDANKLKTIFYRHTETIFEQDLATATLVNSNGDTVATYTGECPVNEEGEPIEYEGGMNYPKTFCVFKTSDNVADLPSGEYNFIIAARAILVGSETTEALQNRNTEPFTYALQVKEAEKIDLSSYFTNFIPAEDSFTLETCATGLAQVVWNVNGALTFNAQCPEKAALYKDGTKIYEFDLSDEEVVQYQSTSAIAEGDDDPTVNPTVPSGSAVLAFMFYADEVFDTAANEPGEYSITLPEGAFLNGDLKSAPYTKTYVFAQNTPQLITPEFQFTPAVGSAQGTLETITLTIPEASYLTYGGNGKATLTGPANGLPKNSTYPKAPDGETLMSANSKSITWTFSNVEWVDGEYTLTIPAKTLNINSANYDDSEALSGNVDLITGTWNLVTKDGIDLIGIEKADAYTVYTVGGVALMVDAPAGKLSELPAGVYIINGKTVVIR